MIHFQATMYVTSDGRFIAARDTDQAGKRGFGEQERTYCGRPVEICGDSYTIERNYQKPVINRAMRKARRRELALAIQGEALRLAAVYNFAADTPPVILADYLEEIHAANDFVKDVRDWQALMADEEAFAAAKESRIEQLRRESQQRAQRQQAEAASKRTQRKREQRRRAKQRRAIAATEKANRE